MESGSTTVPGFRGPVGRAGIGLAALGFSFLTASASAQGPFDYTEMWSENAAIPDNDSSGFAATRTVITPFDEITNLVVTLDLRGGWNGDLYAYLTHDSGRSVLLNRPGRTAAAPFGQGGIVGGMLVSFTDSALADVHAAVPAGADGYLSGTFQPDARESDPGVVDQTSPRTAFLSSFNGLDPNGKWTLYVADLSSGGTTRLTSWGISIQAVQTVPEPAVPVLAALGALLLMRGRRK